MPLPGSLGVHIPRILLPRPGTDLTRWAVIACDQFTSEPEYWRAVAETVGDAPSTLHLVLPEIYLTASNYHPGSGLHDHTQRIQAKMRSYIESGLFVEQEGLIYVERTVHGHTRRGLVLALDLEHYDYRPHSRHLIHITEQTVLERLPARVQIRAGAPLELPHILVLIDDPERTVIGPLARQHLPLCYDFDLMLNSGHLRGYILNDQRLLNQVFQALEKLAEAQMASDHAPLLFAVGDGNHSLAAAKAYWEQIKPQVHGNHPARYVLVEVINTHNPALQIKPIHRILFKLKHDILSALHDTFGADFHYSPCNSQAEIFRCMQQTGDRHTFGIVCGEQAGLVSITNPVVHLPVATLQAFLDAFLEQGGAESIDYVHGEDIVGRLGSQPGNAGFYLPAIPKSSLFKTILLEDVLPRKAFSLGTALEKRFYMECREIA